MQVVFTTLQSSNSFVLQRSLARQKETFEDERRCLGAASTQLEGVNSKICMVEGEN